MGELKKWVKQDWVRIGTDGKIKGKCGGAKKKKYRKGGMVSCCCNMERFGRQND